MRGDDDWRVDLDAFEEAYLLGSAYARSTCGNCRPPAITTLTDRPAIAGRGERSNFEVLSFLAKCATSAQSLRGFFVLVAHGAPGTVQKHCVGRRVQFASGAANLLLLLGPAQCAIVAGSNLRNAMRRAERLGLVRMGRHVHDQSGQHALCLKLSVSSPTDPDRTPIAHRPSPIDEPRFGQTLQVLAESCSPASRVPSISEVVGEPPELNTQAEAALFPVLQRAPTNIPKQATGVNSAIVTLQHHKVSLRAMHERTARSGGGLKQRSTDIYGKGASVVVGIHNLARYRMGLGHAG